MAAENSLPTIPITPFTHGRNQKTKATICWLVLSLLGLLSGACSTNTKDSGGTASADTQLPFREITQTTGIDFVHENGFTGVYFLSEIMGAGAALFDYDNDGDQDLYLVQSHDLSAEEPHLPNTQFHDRLYRNTWVETGRLMFEDVTAASKIEAFGYGMGVAAGDYDNDGWVDLYITNLGSNQLLRNLGNGTFEDVTAKVGVDDPSWSVSASWVDYDRDGWLDLYVGNFSDFNYDNNRQCFGANRDYCSPLSYAATLDTLFRNRGDGTFENVSESAGIHQATGRALGVIAADYNNDGWMDIYIANDSSENQLWTNQKNGTFKDIAMLAGAALNRTGMPEASMGVDAGDFDNDGDEDLFMTHLGNQTNTIYLNDGNGWFEDYSHASGLGAPSLPFTGFGTAWFDYDNDSFLDIFIANGAVKRPVQHELSQGMTPYNQRNQLFRNRGNGTFSEIIPPPGTSLAIEEVSRSAAFGDLDNDGDPDIVLTNNAGPTRVYENQVGQNSTWVGLKLVNSVGRDDLGAKIQIVFTDGSSLWRRCRTDGSYASSNDSRVLFGIPEGKKTLASLSVHWSDGTHENFPPPALKRYTILVQGNGNVSK